MDYKPGSKKGSGGIASSSDAKRAREQRLRRLALENIDIENDPYISKTHLGSYECRLCLTTHISETSYLAHTQGKKHQANLERRQAKLEKDNRPEGGAAVSALSASKVKVRKTVKIGRPGYKITKIRHGSTKQLGLLFQIDYPEIGTDITPRYRFMSAFEQKVDLPPDKSHQYLLVAAEPYETCGFKIEAKEVDYSKFWDYYDQDHKKYYLQMFYK
ncbi:pre-mRNA-splicing factor Prp11p [Trichomonascus vanleenenianus]|uniref:spliceosome assembly protein PRP11 n=1 Tax=Trichomonascus vanleenenianus TaxID=2268995 RepID=UPI003ECB381B